MSDRSTADETISEAQQVHDELSAALERAGIVLPSLGIDPVWLSGTPPRVLIELGRCNVETALALAAALKPHGSARGQGARA
ncbi:hypothetical protein [Streptomyces pinistramenti]|uniref:hypothetical protein n=1 Tax=Streptomyces pinistramenti TaxID=2884812 RepID=UPI001D097FC3|nr:hypothetical protein [Streptomyces pinistramenti]MCB5910823.1 hypothetical protein [Streptomyces pinistramenti]